ncbi:hypothetical protein FMEAI12_2020011 [Parafrankia sp. Ea1.12]|nr:hypothetical protein FMEAI12_2020011 [Parafrankia sp. Ea1.12]
MAFVLTAGQAADSPQFIPVLTKVRVPGARRPSPRPPRRGRRGQGLRVPQQPSLPAETPHQAVIPEKRDQAANRKKKGSKGGRPVSHDTDLYTERNTVERLINKLKAWRGIATGYDKTPQSYLAGLPTHGYREAPGGSSCCSTRMRLPSRVDVGVRLCRISQLTACSADVGAAGACER